MAKAVRGEPDPRNEINEISLENLGKCARGEQTWAASLTPGGVQGAIE